MKPMDLNLDSYLGLWMDQKWTKNEQWVQILDLHPVNLGLTLYYRKACGSSEFTIMLIQGLLDWMSNKRFCIYCLSLSLEEGKGVEEWNSTVESPIENFELFEK